MDEYERARQRARTVLTVVDKVALWTRRLAILWAVSIITGAFVGRIMPYDHLAGFASLCLSGAAGVALLRRWGRKDDEKKAQSNV